MGNKDTKIILVIVVVVSAILGLIGGNLYVQWKQGQVVDMSQFVEQTVPAPSWADPSSTDNVDKLIIPSNDGSGVNDGSSGGQILDAMPDDEGVLDSMPDDGGDEVASKKTEDSDREKEKKSKPLTEKEKKEKELKELLRKEHIEFYKELVANPDKLGFVPDTALFKDVYMSIRSSYVENVSDEKLYDGVIKEVGILLEGAGIPKDGLKKLDPNRNALSQLDELYGKDIDQRVLYYSAIEGMLLGLDDPYTILMTPEEYGRLQEDVQSKGFGGIGIYIEMDKEAGNQITVADPLEGTPAEKAGLETGDKIMAIDGEPTKGMALDIATSKIRGPVGSQVVLNIERVGVSGRFDVSITRGMIHVMSVSSKMMADNIGYIRLRNFGAKTGQELHKEIEKILKNGAKSLILDLRNNGGGYIDASIDVVSEFVQKGSIVVYTEGRVEKRHNFISKKAPQVDMPVVVLINRFSASASEITAGALRDHRVAKLIGETSFGKGSVQQLFPYKDGSALKMTVALFYSPSGYKINHRGIVPDLVKDMDPRLVGKFEKDIQLQRAIKYLQEGK